MPRSVEDGWPAFPSLDIYEAYDRDTERYKVQSDTATGMALRDWFAGRAMAAMLARDIYGPSTFTHGSAAAMAYEVADAMIVERDK